MICLRCGTCCITHDIIVPISSTEAAHKPSRKKCWNLSFKDGKAVCKIHNKKFYKRSPCACHTQSGPSGVCRMGEFMLLEKNKELLEEFCSFEVAIPEPIQILNGIK